jgi:hypothetical protein
MRAASVVPSFNGINVCSMARTAGGNVGTIKRCSISQRRQLTAEAVGISRVLSPLDNVQGTYGLRGRVDPSGLPANIFPPVDVGLADLIVPMNFRPNSIESGNL